MNKIKLRQLLNCIHFSSQDEPQSTDEEELELFKTQGKYLNENQRDTLHEEYDQQGNKFVLYLLNK